MRNKDAYGHSARLARPDLDGPANPLVHNRIPALYQDLIYSKGGYVLQMLRMQMMNPRDQDPDHAFKEMMQDYCKTFDNKAASTEDFKAIVEKHMTHGMDLDGNHKMDWFFNQYVYGMGEAQYTFHVDDGSHARTGRRTSREKSPVLASRTPGRMPYLSTPISAIRR